MTEERPEKKSPVILKLISIILQILFKGVLPIALVIGAVMVGNYLMNNTKKAERKKRDRLATLVQVTPVVKVTEPVIVEAMGTVVPARELTPRPFVDGPVEYISANLQVGGRINQGETLIKIDPRDYELVVAQRKNDVAVAATRVTEAERRLAFAQRDLEVERGRVVIAKQDLEALGKEIDPANEALVLRKPQLAAIEAEVRAARAAVQSAESALEAEKSRLAAAELDLTRVTVIAPYNVVVEEKMVDKGDRVGTGTQIAKLVGSDEFFIVLSVPSRELKWIKFPDDPTAPGGLKDASVVKVVNGSWPAGTARTGYVYRLLPQVDTRGRMARVLVVVKDPLSLQPENQDLQPIMANTFVKGYITGKEVKDVIRVPREYVREGDRVWVMNDQDQLETHEIEVAYKARDHFYVAAGLDANDRVISSVLSTPVDGMDLRTSDTAAKLDENPDVSLRKIDEESDRGK